jgi:polysaccharide export outer membrane protein
LLASTLLLGGCAFAPGGHVSYQTEAASLDGQIDVEPITPELISAQRPAARVQNLVRLSEQSRASRHAYEYQIGKGDVLSIIVYGYPELTIPAGSQRSAAEAGNSVHSDGSIFYPYIGRVLVAGRTVGEVREIISRRLARYIAEPQVEVRVAAFNSQKVLVTGEVRDPSLLPITNVPMTLLDALSTTGGPAETANWHAVQLTRDGEIRKFSLYELLSQGDLSQDVLLRDGDVLYVPDIGDQQVFVMGEVGFPQALPMGRSHMTLVEALSRAGSFKETQADASGIFVFRRNQQRSDKLATVYQLDARNAVAMVLGTEFRLEPTDIVYVTTTPLGRWNRLINQLLPSVTAVYQVARTGRDVNELRDDL